MKKLIQTIKNIFKIEELRTRIGYTLLLLLVYRLGSFIVLPGIDSALIANSDLAQNSSEGLMGLLNMFSGGAFGIYRNPASWCFRPLLQKTSDGGRKRTPQDEPVYEVSYHRYHLHPGSCLHGYSSQPDS